MLPHVDHFLGYFKHGSATCICIWGYACHYMHYDAI